MLCCVSYAREYLERAIIICKGSTEKAKKKLDKTCTFRTLMPAFFEIHNPRDLVKEYDNIVIDGFLPKLTKDHYRVYVLRNIGKRFESSFSNYYKFTIMLCEYLQRYDYCNGILVLFDYRETNIMELLKNISIMELRQALTIVVEGFSFRIKGLHFLTSSKTIETFINMVVKQVLNEKLVNRIHVHKDISTLKEHIPLEILPVEYGGKEKSMEKIHNELIDELSTKEFMDYLQEMSAAKTDESKRQTDKFYEQYLGTPGSFRSLSVD
ncbi:uncharacterized protein LOC119834647 isoform X2 [Zerene cesonia]|uniref:uncharacterized protein LOC119834647 isoform X2 n=1 Tax=Zerene cesonia TaxID=33412 RepID=UPI0018E4F2CF|nr:uncharacterized protein LOC119834647 isoform X2 [Zerene cesonia]